MDEKYDIVLASPHPPQTPPTCQDESKRRKAFFAHSKKALSSWWPVSVVGISKKEFLPNCISSTFSSPLDPDEADEILVNDLPMFGKSFSIFNPSPCMFLSCTKITGQPSSSLSSPKILEL